MVPQNYSAVDAYRRWAGVDMREQLRRIRRNYFRHRLAGMPTALEYKMKPQVGIFAKWRTVILGRVTWAVFAGAYWAIYQPGVNPLFYGSVLFSLDDSDGSSPALFEVAEYSRKVMEYDVPLEGIEEYAKVIRDDYSLPPTIKVPLGIATKEGVFLQSVGVERAKLPHGYLHHRLVSVVHFPGSKFVSIIHHRHWGNEFRNIWCAGDASMSKDQLATYRADFPQVTP